MTKTSSTVYTYTYTVQTGDGTGTVTVGTGTDAAGNVVTSTPTSGATFTVDNTAPTQTVSGVDINADTGTSNSDFITKTAAQTISGTLSANLAESDILNGSVNNGSGWTNITSKVSGTGITWNGATLSGSSNILFKITDAAGNDSNTSGSQAYVLDTTAPTASLITTGEIDPSSNQDVVVKSTEAGKVYLVCTDKITVSVLDNITSADVNYWNEVTISEAEANSNKTLETDGLRDQDGPPEWTNYHAYAVDAAGNFSSLLRSSNSVSVKN